MNRITALFKNKPRNVLNVYCTAGFPQAESTLPVLRALQKSGADMIELGMPYSDPVADGETIQQSNMCSLQNGTTLQSIFAQLENFRQEIHIPVILMGYLNPVLQYGFDAFCARAAACGVDGLIIPDIPAYAYEREFEPIVRKYALGFSFLVTPETSPERILQLDALTNGFLYAVTASSTTGSNSGNALSETYLQRLAAMPLKNPVLAGFGIKNRHDFAAVCRYVNGGIVGSAYIREIAGANDVEAVTEPFIKNLRG